MMELGLWSSIAITLSFSIFVILMDEVIHARRKKKKDGTGTH